MLLLVLATPAIAWNAAGHRLSAMIAWQGLDEGTRSAVTEILRQHPDFARWQAHPQSADPDLAAFLGASTWPDDIRRDTRFYTAGAEAPTTTQPGFPDMERRLNWHYVDRPLPPFTKPLPSPGVIDRQLAALARTLVDPESTLGERAYALPWLIHLVGDAHQPLHTASRYGPNGQSDNGGNALEVVTPFHLRSPSMSLHRYWDDLPGPPWLSGSRLESVARSLMDLHAPPATPGTPEDWIVESWRIASEYAYPLDGDAVPMIGAEFHERALAIASRRVTEAGYRLADLLRRLIRDPGPRSKADPR